MITVRKRESSGVSGRTARGQAKPSLTPALSKLMRESARSQAPTAERKRIAVDDRAMSAGMLRIFEQYRAGTYRAADYSTRTCQRHRKYFLFMGIDLRKPFSPSAPPNPPLPELRKKSVPSKKLKSKLSPVSVPGEATYRKAEQANVTIAARIKRMLVQIPQVPARLETAGGTVVTKVCGLRAQRHKATAKTMGLAAIARLR